MVNKYEELQDRLTDRFGSLGEVYPEILIADIIDYMQMQGWRVEPPNRSNPHGRRKPSWR